MTLTIDLPPDTHGELEKRATESGTDAATLAAVLLQNSLRNISAAKFPEPTEEEWREIQEAVRRSGASADRFRPWEEVKAEKNAKYGV